ncbi:hypothetical protein, partial [Mesorhizobium sp. M2D.F.Ca.ET.223.01.1.1]|uniref:hypothetical protein n=1 Tax=Mesorhizobium sp. M2D.F.Ca.ET.223.01.1.1 TaxID=2563940 RepID=UPI001AEF3571
WSSEAKLKGEDEILCSYGHGSCRRRVGSGFFQPVSCNCLCRLASGGGAAGFIALTQQASKH